MITSFEFANFLRGKNKKTPLTENFEREQNGSLSKYAQKDKRWWDNSTGTQAEHVICWFSRKYYANGSTELCVNENYKCCCKSCYFVNTGKYPSCKPQMKEAERVYRYLNRPEMYLWIAEVLNILPENELKECIADLKLEMDVNPRKWKKKLIKRIPWALIEEKIELSDERGKKC